MDQSLSIESVLEHPTGFHSWGKGGLSSEVLRKIYNLCREGAEQGGNLHTLETGAGMSTLAFLAADPVQHIVVEMDKRVIDRIIGYLTETDIATDNLQIANGAAEHELPSICLDREPYLDFALLDGGHGWPTVFVQLCFVNMILKQGGHLMIDDIQLYSVDQMYQFLKHQPGWEQVSPQMSKKTVIFRKEVSYQIFPHFKEQPFIVEHSEPR